MVVSYRAWVAEVVARYRDNPTIMAWEILNEPEVRVREPLPGNDPGCAANADSLLYNFAADITGLIKSLDPNHLVSLGTIGGGQCGSDNARYSTLHAIAGIDLCSVHDYDRPDDAIAGDQFNGIAIRMRQCRDLGKPIFVGEAGLTLPQTAGSTTLRAQKLNAKLLAEFRAGTVGYMFWGWANPPRAGVDIHDIGPGDPVLSMLTVPSSTWPYDGGDTDNDGVSNAIDSGAGWDDHQGTTGAITDANGLSAVVLDAPAPGGVTIFVPGVGSPPRPMKLSSCGTTVEIDSGSSATLTCGSVTAQVMTGRVRVRLSADTFVEIPAGTTAKVAFSANGAFTVSDIVGSGVSVRVEGATTSLASGGPPQSFAAWTFTGFAFPISNTARNSVTAGQTVHLGWLLRDPSGKPVTTLRQVTIRVTGITPCPGGRVVADGTPVTFTLNHGLYYLGLGVYILEWTTPKVYKGSCKLMRLDLGEGVTRNASFTFK